MTPFRAFQDGLPGCSGARSSRTGESVHRALSTKPTHTFKQSAWIFFFFFFSCGLCVDTPTHFSPSHFFMAGGSPFHPDEGSRARA